MDPNKLKTLDLGGPIASNPVVWEGVAIFGNDSGNIVAVDQNCHPIWEYGADGSVEAHLSVDDEGTLYFAANGQIGALNSTSGEEIWTNAIDAPLPYQPTQSEDTIYLVDGFSALHGYSKESGRLMWSNGEASFIGSPLIIGNRMFINTDLGELVMLDLEGNLVNAWRLNDVEMRGEFTAGFPTFSPIEVNGLVALIDDRANIYFLVPMFEEEESS